MLFNIFNEILNYFLNGIGILNVLYISGKMKKKEKEKSESFCLRENVYCVVDLFIKIYMCM